MDITLEAKKRSKTTKAKTLRKEGWVPGCVYGKGMETLNIQIPVKALQKTMKAHAHKLELNVEGKTFLVGIEEVQKGALGDKLDHISFHALNKNEKATLHVEMHITGKSLGQMEGGVIDHMIHNISIKGYPQDLPDAVIVDVSALNIGDIIHVSDIASQYKFEFLPEDMDKVIVKCSHAKILEVPETVVEEELVASAEEGAEVVPFPQGETTPVEEQKEEKKKAA